MAQAQPQPKTKICSQEYLKQLDLFSLKSIQSKLGIVTEESNNKSFVEDSIFFHQNNETSSKYNQDLMQLVNELNNIDQDLVFNAGSIMTMKINKISSRMLESWIMQNSDCLANVLGLRMGDIWKINDYLVSKKKDKEHDDVWIEYKGIIIQAVLLGVDDYTPYINKIAYPRVAKNAAMATYRQNPETGVAAVIQTAVIRMDEWGILEAAIPGVRPVDPVDHVDPVAPESDNNNNNNNNNNDENNNNSNRSVRKKKKRKKLKKSGAQKQSGGGRWWTASINRKKLSIVLANCDEKTGQEIKKYLVTYLGAKNIANYCLKLDKQYGATSAEYDHMKSLKWW